MLVAGAWACGVLWERPSGCRRLPGPGVAALLQLPPGPWAPAAWAPRPLRAPGAGSGRRRGSGREAAVRAPRGRASTPAAEFAVAAGAGLVTFAADATPPSGAFRVWTPRELPGFCTETCARRPRVAVGCAVSSVATRSPCLSSRDATSGPEVETLHVWCFPNLGLN